MPKVTEEKNSAERISRDTTNHKAMLWAHTGMKECFNEDKR